MIKRVYLLGEILSLYIGIPTALVLLRMRFRSLPVIPLLWLAAIPAAVWLHNKRGYSIGRLFGLGEVAISERTIAWIIIRSIPAVMAMFSVMHHIHPDWLLSFASSRPLFWLVVMIAYPVLSVMPQGVIYRSLFTERYGELFDSPVTRGLVAALCFSFSHIFFLNVWALVLTFVGGILFWTTYEKTGSALLANLEHGFYGDLAFTLGYGAFLYHGADFLEI